MRTACFAALALLGLAACDSGAKQQPRRTQTQSSSATTPRTSTQPAGQQQKAPARRDTTQNRDPLTGR